MVLPKAKRPITADYVHEIVAFVSKGFSAPSTNCGTTPNNSDKASFCGEKAGFANTLSTSSKEKKMKNLFISMTLVLFLYPLSLFAIEREDDGKGGGVISQKVDFTVSESPAVFMARGARASAAASSSSSPALGSSSGQQAQPQPVFPPAVQKGPARAFSSHVSLPEEVVVTGPVPSALLTSRDPQSNSSFSCCVWITWCCSYLCSCCDCCVEEEGSAIDDPQAKKRILNQSLLASKIVRPVDLNSSPFTSAGDPLGSLRSAD
jgi:hypothetical protein